MAKILDPDSLSACTFGSCVGGESVIYNTSARTITIVPFEDDALSNISSTGTSATNGVTFQCLYSFAKEQWRTSNELIKFPFPFVSITEESFELVNQWDFVTGVTTDTKFSRNLIRDGGWSLKNSGGTSTEEYMNITTLGAFDDSAADKAYYVQVTGNSATPTDMVYFGEVNQPVKIFGDVTHGNVDYRDIYKLYLREQGKTYGFYDLLTEQNLSTVTFKKFALPLSNSTDLNITASDAVIATGATYTGITLEYYVASGFSEDIGGTFYPFHVDVIADGQTKENVYEKVQYLLRQSTDIDSTANFNIRGDIAEELLSFVGATLETNGVLYDPLYTGTTQGVFISNFQAADTNDLVFTDSDGNQQTFPFVAAGLLQFNDNLVTDTNAVYRVFFTNCDTYENDGSDFGTTLAITIDENNGTDIAGSATASTIAFDYDYDNNVQRGNSSSGQTVPFTAVAIGLDTAQYVVTTGSIVRSTSNVVNYVAALERNYLNP